MVRTQLCRRLLCVDWKCKLEFWIGKRKRFQHYVSLTLQFKEARTSEDTSHHLVTPSIFEILSFPHQRPGMGSLPSTVPAVKV
jgi:hypothetical protein